MREQREHARLAVSVEVQVRPAGGTRWSAATLSNISRGGCRLLVKEGVGGPDDDIEVWLPSKREEGLTVSAKIFRVTAKDDGNLLIAKLQPRDSTEQIGLEWVFTMLLSRSGGGRRANVRVAYRLDIQYGNDAELRGILEDISRSGFLMLSVETAPKLYQSVRVVIMNPDGSKLSLRASVVRRVGAFTESGPGHLVGLLFDRLSDREEQRISDLLHQLVVPD